ncbi:hypothetical protein LINGRAHAP2_LOCUS21002 [Linum grandiflorum]
MAQVSEAEITSLNQQKRIDELEAQLGEAEDIVKDLRSELRELQDELERVMTNQMKPLWEDSHVGGNANSMTSMEHNAISTPVPTVSSLPVAETDPVAATEIANSPPTISYNDHRNKHYSENGSHKDSCFICDPGFASIMMRNKEPELYKNGCTHRIRALEGNILGGSHPIVEKDDGGKQQICNGDDKEGKHACPKLAAKDDDIAHGLENNEDEVKIPTESEYKPVYVLKSFRRKQKRATRYRKRKLSFRRFPDQNLDKNAERGEGPRIQCKDSELEVARKENTDSKEVGTQLRSAEATEVNVNFLRSCSVQITRTNDTMSVEEEDIKSVEDSKSIACKCDNGILVDSKPNVSEANPHSNKTAEQSRIGEATEVSVNIHRSCSVQIARNNDKLSVEEEDLTSVEGSESLASKCGDEISSLLLIDSKPINSEANPHSNEMVIQSTMAEGTDVTVNCLKPCSVQSTRSNVKMSVVEEDLKSVDGSDSAASKCDNEMANPHSNVKVIQSRVVEATEGNVNFLRPSSVQNTSSSDKLSVEEDEVKCTEGSKSLGSKSSNEVANVLLRNSEPNESEAKESVAVQPVSSKLIKYTFTRKRKRESLTSPDGKSGIGDGFLKRRMGDKQEVDLKESGKLD